MDTLNGDNPEFENSDFEKQITDYEFDRQLNEILRQEKTKLVVDKLGGHTLVFEIVFNTARSLTI